MTIPRLSYQRYRRIANEILERGGVDHSTLPTDVELLVDRLGMDIIPFSGLKRNYDIKGLVLKRRNAPGFDIGIDQNHWENDEQQCQFTIAEELAHVFLHSSMFSALTDVEKVWELINSIPEKEYGIMEQQARNVASFILLPDTSFRKYVLDFSTASASSLKRMGISSREELARELADRISHQLNLSSHVLFHSILYRYPDPLIIDEVIRENERLL